jgi:hypothetical protein
MNKADTLFGRMVIEQKFCTDDEVKLCEEEQKRASGQPSLWNNCFWKSVSDFHPSRTCGSIRESRDSTTRCRIQYRGLDPVQWPWYKAKQLSLESQHRVLPEKLAESECGRFYKEAGWRRLNHNNIVRR